MDFSDNSNEVTKQFYVHTSAKRVDTDSQIYRAVKLQHPSFEVTIVPVISADIKGYASATGDAGIHPIKDDEKYGPSSLKWTVFIPPAKRLDGGSGIVAQEAFYERFLVRWKDQEFLVYLCDCRDGGGAYPSFTNQYIVSNDMAAVKTLVATVGRWGSQLHNEIWVFNQGFWDKDAELYAAIQKSHWEDVILDRELKEDLVDTIQRFYDSRGEYQKLGVPWKRGMIFYGPPGNGKTISIKATMHTLYKRSPPIPTLYVKSFTSFAGPEYSILSIFNKARQEAPCYLVFEDLDSMVTPDVRSFFLNAVDGLSENEGILMVGSTNHIDQLDPGLAKRPSRFDRKYMFPDPNTAQRTRYAEFWQRKLKDNQDIEFPDELCPAIAGITDGFSFAYMQEAFVSALLSIAGRKEMHEHKIFTSKDEAEELEKIIDQWDILELDGKAVVKTKRERRAQDRDDLDKYVLWREIKAQVEELKKEISKDTKDEYDTFKNEVKLALTDVSRDERRAILKHLKDEIKKKILEA